MDLLELTTLQAEYDLIVKLLIEHKFSKKKVAEFLGITVKTLHNKIDAAHESEYIKKSFIPLHSIQHQFQ